MKETGGIGRNASGERRDPLVEDSLRESASVPALGAHFVDLRAQPGQTAPLSFTFYWTEAGHWEGRNFHLTTEEEGHG